MSYNEAGYPLLANGAATGGAVTWRGGRGVFAVPTGTFGGSTVSLQWSPDAGVTWLQTDRSGDTFCTLTAAGAGLFELPPCSIRCAIAGGSPSGINATAFAL